jgi:15-cis-phytoene desaturase
VAKDPVGVKGEDAIDFGGGYTTVGKREEELLRESDPAQFVGGKVAVLHEKEEFVI